MTDDDVLAEFRAAEALLEGHFILSSGLRSSRYLQCARVVMSPPRAQPLAQALAAKIPADVKAPVTAVTAPALGGLNGRPAPGRPRLQHAAAAKHIAWCW